MTKRRRTPLASLPLSLALAMALVGDEARADAPTATATCEHAAGPGRVRCEAEVHADAGATLRWADVQILETPAFVSALKGRIGPADATVRERATWRFSFGIVARARGTGDLKLRVRAVVCRGEQCTPELVNVVVPVASGT